jgi:NAD(P)H-dependent flavin oxidoreductase YrpB (nitropropane dioxygenase family)
MPKLNTKLTELLNIDLPILGFSHSVNVTAALSKAGGMGVYGIAHDPPEEVPVKIAAIRDQAPDVPIGIDIMMPKGMPETDTLETVRAQLPDEHVRFVDSLFEKYKVPASTSKGFFNSVLRTPAYFEGQLQALLQSDVEMVAFGIGLTADAVQRLQAKGKVVGALIGHPHHFAAYQAMGLDFVVAQGGEAGGHTGSIATMVLVPEIVQMAGDMPVLAAGGIGHGAQIAATLAMGAQGVWMGTSWLSSVEHATGDHATSDKILDILVGAGSGDTGITRGDSGKPQRQVRSAWAEEWAGPDAPQTLKMPYQHALVGDLLTAIYDHEVDGLLHYPAGQGVTWTKGKRSIADIVAELYEQTNEGLNRAGGLAG